MTTTKNITNPVNHDQQTAKACNRILSRVSATASGCLEYQGRIDPATGYSRVKLGSVNSYGHRIMAARFVGDPTGLHVHHTCHNRKCVNPSHLQLMSASDHARLTAAETAENKLNKNRAV